MLQGVLSFELWGISGNAWLPVALLSSILTNTTAVALFIDVVKSGQENLEFLHRSS